LGCSYAAKGGGALGQAGGLDFSFVNDSVGSDVSENDTVFRHGESETIALSHVTFPDVFPTVIAVNV